ncbi:MAG: DNA primase [Candidatus Eisenbacteria bacterium]|nr:DNA primase [Candidatus Eisenbacteria bacterium]
MYAPELIDRIRSSVDIVGIIGERVSLKKAGRNYKGLCPFHNEKTPSFIVSPEKQLYHCFGCGAGGNVFTFLTSTEKMSFSEAANYLADKGGVRLPKAKAENEEYSRLYEANELAAGFFENSLWGDAGKKGKEYLKTRGVREETARELRLGLALPGWRNLLDHGGKLLGDELLLRAGLLVRDDQSGATYDRFRDRLMFPVESVSSRIVGFGGRALDDSLPKYLNSPETAIYKKSDILYGFSRTKRSVREAGFAFLVEGYMDFIALFESGIRNVVAVSGTSLTPGHARMLKGAAEKVSVVFDADRAGIAAAMRSIGILLEGGLRVNVICLPQGHDPDTYIRKVGREKFLEDASISLDAIEFLRDCFASEKKSREEALRNIVELIARAEDPLSRRVLVERTAAVFSFDEAVLFTETERRRSGERPGVGLVPAKPAGLSVSNIELEYLALLVSSPSLPREALQPIEEELFADPLLRKVARTILDCGETLEGNGVAGLLHRIEDEEAKSLLSRLAIEDKFSGVDRETVLKDYVKKLKQMALRRRASEIDQDIKRREKQGIDATSLLEEKSGIMAELKELYG